MLLDVWFSRIRAPHRVALGSVERGYPAPWASIAGQNRNGCMEAQNRQFNKTEENLLRRFGHYPIGDR